MPPSPVSAAEHADAVAWAARQLGSPVVARRELTGGSTSVLLALTTAAGDEAVLRLITEEPWRTHGAELATREASTQRELVGSGLPVPRSLALDAAGEACGHPAHLMTLLPGETDTDRVDDDALVALAATLAAVHAVEQRTPARTYQSWAWEAKHVVPAWARRPAAWLEAFALLRRDPPAYDPVLVHRDYSARNVLWRGGAVSGLVDWVEASTGPAWLDVAHCATNLVIGHGLERAGAFAAAYVALTGREAQPYYDVMDVVFLPPPGRAASVTEPGARLRLEEHLAARLAAR